MPKKCIVLDLETIPLHAAILDDPKFDFTLPIFHQIICASYAVLDDSFKVVDMDVLGLDKHTEKEAVAKLSAMVDKDTMVVTWSGRRFDLPVLLYRALVHGVPCPWYFKNDFDKRFSTSGHFDLQDNMMLFGAADKIKLDHAAAVIGLPGKMDVHGSDVAALWARNRYTEIGAYCVSDVVQTAVLFARWAYLRGSASAEEVGILLDSFSKCWGVGLPGDKAGVVVAQGVSQVVSACNWERLRPT